MKKLTLEFAYRSTNLMNVRKDAASGDRRFLANLTLKARKKMKHFRRSTEKVCLNEFFVVMNREKNVARNDSLSFVITRCVTA